MTEVIWGENMPFSQKELEQKCQDNAWLKRGGVIFEDDPCAENDYTYCFTECKTIEELKEYFLRGNWAIRQGFIYNSLAFINQVNGGDEWWTVKKFPDGKLIAFESITAIRIIETGDHNGNPFEEFIGCMLRATKEQCRKLTYDEA